MLSVSNASMYSIASQYCEQYQPISDAYTPVRSGGVVVILWLGGAEDVPDGGSGARRATAGDCAARYTAE